MKVRSATSERSLSRGVKIVESLLRIAPDIADIETRRQSRLLAAMLIVMTVGFGVMDLRGVLTNPGYVVPWHGYVFLIGSYLVNRYWSYTLAASLTVLMFPVVIFTQILSFPSISQATTLYYLSVGFLIGGIFLSFRMLAVYAFLNAVAIVSLHFLDRSQFPSFNPFVGPLSLNIIVSLLALLTMAHRQSVKEEQQQELSESEARWRTIFDSVNEAVFVHDLENGAILEVNKKMCEMYGYTDKEAVRLTVEQLSAGEFPFTQVEALGWMKKASQGEPQIFEWKAKRKSGELFWVEVSVRRASIGGMDRLLVTVRDINDRKIAEDALRKSDVLFRRVWEDSRDGMRIMDGAGSMILVNETFCRMVGKKREDLQGRPFTDLYLHATSGEVYTGMLAYRDGYARRSMPTHIETEIALWNGSKKWFEISNSYLDVQDQKPLVLSMFRDISERKKADEQVRKLTQAVEQSQVSVVITDLSGNIEYVNTKFCEVTGYTREEVLGRNPRVLKSGYTAREEYEQLWRTIIAGREWRGEFHNKKKSGELYWESASIMPIKDERGAITHFLALKEDISARKRVEEELRKLNEQLELRVLTRTAELQTANRELESFSYSVSHDLRAPLRHISGYLELLKDEYGASFNEKGRRYLETAAKSAVRLGNLIDDLLAFSRVSRAEVKKSEVDLHRLVEEVKAELERETKNRTIDWKIGPMRAVQADPTLLRQVMMNLMTNAVKFTRERDKARIEVGCMPEKEGDIGVTVYVRDNGAGFDMKYAAKLFGVFQRLHRADEFEGTGIGLANVRRIIQRHGGRTWAEGAVDQGATFYFTLICEKGKTSS